MIWKTKTHEFSSTLCQRTGKPCPALARLARAMVDAIETAGRCATQDFEIEGSSDLHHCPEGCTARFHARRDQIRLFSGIDAEAPVDGLDRYADVFFGSEFRTLTSDTLATRPCAMLQVRSHAPQKSAKAPLQATA